MTDNPCAVDGTQEEADSIASQYARRNVALANDLVHGTLTMEDFHTRMQDSIRLSFIHQAIAGTKDADERELTQADLQRIEGKIAEQYQYLDGFMDKIEAAVQKDGASLEFIANQASMYAGSSEQEYWQQATNVDLPHTPRDGSTRCLSNCQCSVRLECVRDDKGKVIAVNAYWETEANPCPDCEARGSEWNPYVIPMN
jgi:hypothetical protein